MSSKGIIVVGTNRPKSRSLAISQIIKNIYKKINVNFEILELSKLDFSHLNGTQYSDNQPQDIKNAIDKISQARSLVMVVPEYNGGIPGVLKYFIDHWKYPDCFEYRPVSFVGLGGRFGGLRPVEHLQQVFGYRNSYIFPERVFLCNVWNVLKDQTLTDPVAIELLEKQALLFNKFIEALESSQLDANSFNTIKNLEA